MAKTSNAVKQDDKLIYTGQDSGGAMPGYNFKICAPENNPPTDDDLYTVGNGDEFDFSVEFGQALVNRGLFAVYVSSPIILIVSAQETPDNSNADILKPAKITSDKGTVAKS